MPKKNSSKNYYNISKRYIWVAHDLLSVLVILMTFDKVYKMKSFKVLKPWQLARLIERVPKLMHTLTKR
jgi:hypothetical protein